jgi:hypothetical protein
VARSESWLADRQRPAVQGCRVGLTPGLLVQPGQVVQAERDVRVLRPQGALDDVERLPKEPLRLVGPPLARPRQREIVQHGREVRTVFAHRAAGDVERTLELRRGP